MTIPLRCSENYFNYFGAQDAGPHTSTGSPQSHRPRDCHLFPYGAVLRVTGVSPWPRDWDPSLTVSPRRKNSCTTTSTSFPYGAVLRVTPWPRDWDPSLRAPPRRKKLLHDDFNIVSLRGSPQGHWCVTMAARLGPIADGTTSA